MLSNLYACHYSTTYVADTYVPQLRHVVQGNQTYQPSHCFFFIIFCTIPCICTYMQICTVLKYVGTHTVHCIEYSAFILILECCHRDCVLGARLELSNSFCVTLYSCIQRFACHCLSSLHKMVGHVFST